MNREIKFRGKRRNDGKWVYGYYIYRKFKNEHLMCCNDCEDGELRVYEVIPEIVGQYTGKNDKNNNELYKDDFIKLGNEIYLIKYEDACFWITQKDYAMELHTISGLNFEIISNKFDNPELLK